LKTWAAAFDELRNLSPTGYLALMAQRRSMSCTEICKQNEPTGAGNDIRIAVTSLKSAGLSRPQQNVALIGVPYSLA
jgi:hypothetical protein